MLRSKVASIIIVQNATLDANARPNIQGLEVPAMAPSHLAPMISKGPICLGMLKPNKLANQSIAYTNVGVSRNSVWWRNGRAVKHISLLERKAQRFRVSYTIIAQEADDSVVAESYEIECVAKECRDSECLSCQTSCQAHLRGISQIVPRYEGPQHKLHHIQPYPDREESSNSDLFRGFGQPFHSVRICCSMFHLTSKQYPNSSCSPSPSLVNSPCCRLRPGNPAIPGPSSLPTRKNAAVATSKETARKCTKTKRRVRRTIAPTEFAYAIPHAIPVRSIKKERR